MSFRGSGLHSRNLQKGAFIIPDTKAKIIQFQFNPESLKRELALSEASEGDSSSGQEKEGIGNDLLTDQWLGETVSLDLLLDAKENPTDEGILPILSAIEQLMQPEESQQKDTSQAHKNPRKELRQVIFAWGKTRMLPVKIETLSVEENEFSPDLYPIRAKVTVSMKMLNPDITQGVSQKMKDAFYWTNQRRANRSDKYYLNTKGDKDGTSKAFDDLSKRQ